MGSVSLRGLGKIGRMITDMCEWARDEHDIGQVVIRTSCSGLLLSLVYLTAWSTTRATDISRKGIPKRHSKRYGFPRY